MPPTVEQSKAVSALKELHPEADIQQFPLETGTRIVRVLADGNLVESWYVRIDGYGTRVYPFRQEVTLYLPLAAEDEGYADVLAT